MIFLRGNHIERNPPMSQIGSAPQVPQAPKKQSTHAIRSGFDNEARDARAINRAQRKDAQSAGIVKNLFK